MKRDCGNEKNSRGVLIGYHVALGLGKKTWPPWLAPTLSPQEIAQQSENMGRIQNDVRCSKLWKSLFNHQIAMV